MGATRRERIEAAVGGRVLGNWRSWWRTPDGFPRVADSASATSAAGRVHGSLPIFGVNAYVSKRGGGWGLAGPSIAFNPSRCVLPLAFSVFPPYREHAGINKNNRKLIDSPLDEQFHREFCEPTESSQSIALLSPAAVDPA